MRAALSLAGYGLAIAAAVILSFPLFVLDGICDGIRRWSQVLRDLAQDIRRVWRG